MMSEQKNGQPAEQRPNKRERQAERKEQERIRSTWGISQADFYKALEGRQVDLVTMDNKLYRGILRGVDQFDLVLEDSTGELVIYAKHALKYCRASKPNGEGKPREQ